jgi:hypothetical protein
MEVLFAMQALLAIAHEYRRRRVGVATSTGETSGRAVRSGACFVEFDQPGRDIGLPVAKRSLPSGLAVDAAVIDGASGPGIVPAAVCPAGHSAPFAAPIAPCGDRRAKRLRT